jgi:hypothetical protein
VELSKLVSGTRQHRPDLGRGPAAAARRAHAAGVQHGGDPAQAGDAARADLLDDGRRVFREAARGLGGARGAEPLRLGEVGAVAEPPETATFSCTRALLRSLVSFAQTADSFCASS